MVKGSRKSGGKRADVLASRKPIVEEIVRLMEQGDLGWTEPVAGAMAPHNPVSGCRYRGANRLRLVWEAGKRGWGDSRFVTFNQAKAEGWHVRKGERGVMLEVWKDVPRKVSAEEGGEEEECEWRPRLCCVGSFTVFNAAQVEGIPELHDEPPADSGLEGICETVKAAAPCPVREEGVSGEAYYAPARDEIRIFDRRCAVSLNMFVRVLLHEEIHSTGHVTRLGRFADGACALFGTEDTRARSWSPSSAPRSSRRSWGFRRAPSMPERPSTTPCSTPPTSPRGRPCSKRTGTRSSWRRRRPTTRQT